MNVGTGRQSFYSSHFCQGGEGRTCSLYTKKLHGQTIVPGNEKQRSQMANAPTELCPRAPNAAGTLQLQGAFPRPTRCSVRPQLYHAGLAKSEANGERNKKNRRRRKKLSGSSLTSCGITVLLKRERWGAAWVVVMSAELAFLEHLAAGLAYL